MDEKPTTLCTTCGQNADSVEGIFAFLKKKEPKIVRAVVFWYDADDHYGVAATPFPAKLELLGLIEAGRQMVVDEI